MNNLILFINSFLLYLLLFSFVSILCIISTFTGLKLRKIKNDKQ